MAAENGLRSAKNALAAQASLQDSIDTPSCPVCKGTTLYRFGYNRLRKQKYQCLLCGRQFVPEPARLRYPDKPFCPVCGSIMYLYKKDSGVTRFRCSAYPRCKSYRKEVEEK